MSKRNLLNLILFIFIFVLAALIVYKPGKNDTIIPTTLTNINSSDIHSIKINRHSTATNQQELIFKKMATGWNMVKPYQLNANTFRIDSILKLLSTVSFSQNNLKNLNPDTFGLRKPYATVTFNDKTEIAFGHNKSLKNHRYIKIGSTLHMTADTFYYQLTAKAESYIDHKLLPENSKITRLTLPGTDLEQTKGKWQVSPKTDDTSADSINQLISEWQLSQAYDVLKIKPVSTAKADIIIQLDNKKIIHFKITNNKDNFTLTNLDSGIEYFLSTDRKNKLLKLSDVNQNN